MAIQGYLLPTVLIVNVVRARFADVQKTAVLAIHQLVIARDVPYVSIVSIAARVIWMVMSSAPESISVWALFSTT